MFREGDLCVARCGAPAVYVGSGKCVWVSSMDNDIMISKVSRRRCRIEDPVLPEQDSVQKAIRHVKGNKNYEGYCY